MNRMCGPLRHRAGLRVELPCDLGAVRPAVAQVMSFLEAEQVDRSERSACELALVEACNNAVDHAGKEGRQLKVVVEAACDQEEVELRVEDHTPGFDWPPRPQLPPDDSEEGRGLFLISSLMSSVDYLRGRAGNCLVLRKARTQPLAPTDQATRLAELERRLSEDEAVIREMADELSSCYESLSAIFRYSGEPTRAVGVEEFSQRLLGDLLSVTGNAWYVFRLASPGAVELVMAGSSPEQTAMASLPLAEEGPPDTALEVQAARQHRDVWFEDGSQLPPSDPLAIFGPDSAGWVHPLYLGEELVGTLAVGGPPGGRRFTAAQTSVVQTFADFLAIQVVNARLQEERLRNLLVAQELSIAKQIQRSLLPVTLPELPGFLLAGSCESASEVGGDFYDIIALSDRAFLAVVSDAMGKGLPAAVLAMMLRTLIRALQDLGPRPGELLRRANGLLYEELSRVEMFITAQVAYVDAQAGELVMASAGHCPLLYCPGEGRGVRAVAPDGMPLGVLAGCEFLEERMPLPPGSRLLMYTDGVTETTAPGGEFFGQSRLAAWVGEMTSALASADAMKSRLTTALADFHGTPVVKDDQTFVIVGR